MEENWDNDLFEEVKEEKKRKSEYVKAYSLCVVSLIILVYSFPVVGTSHGSNEHLRNIEIIHGVSWGALSLLLTYISLRIKITLSGVSLLLVGIYFFYPRLLDAFSTWNQ